MKIVLIDNDEFYKKLIVKVINQVFKEINFVNGGCSVKGAIEVLKQNKPNLVILSIEMSDGTGFTVLDYFHPNYFKVIFISAYKHYAKKAFKYKPVDYILKPFKEDELKYAFIKASKVMIE